MGWPIGRGEFPDWGTKHFFKGIRGNPWWAKKLGGKGFGKNLERAKFTPKGKNGGPFGEIF